MDMRPKIHVLFSDFLPELGKVGEVGLHRLFYSPPIFIGMIHCDTVTSQTESRTGKHIVWPQLETFNDLFFSNPALIVL